MTNHIDPAPRPIPKPAPPAPPPPAILTIKDWTLSTNRAQKLLEPAVELANRYIATLDKDTQDICNEKIQNTFLSYVDTFTGVQVPVHKTLKSVDLIKRRLTSPLSDKLIVGEEVIKHGLLHCAPRTYNSKQEVLNSTNNTERLLFVKGRGGSGGREVSCIKYSDLPSFNLKPGYVLQEAIDNIELYENRKMVFRFFILIHNKQVFFNKFAFAAIHGKNFDATSTDHNVQINWFTDDVIRLPLNTFEKYDYYLNMLGELVKSVLPILETVRAEYSTKDSYILLGTDAIPCLDGKARLLEFNTYPNLLKPPVDMLVNMPMFASMMLKLVADVDDGNWIPVNVDQR